jgi:hypothetical protein
MKQADHTITLEPRESLCVYDQLALKTAEMLLRPLEADSRMTVLITLLAEQIIDMAANAEQIDAIVDVLRTQLKQELTPQTAH